MIGPYPYLPASYASYDPVFPEVAGRVRAAILGAIDTVEVEHVGSTAVPGLGGKGIIDLAVLYPAGQLAGVRTVLDRLGFQRQQGKDPWPESRPMRVGTWTERDRAFRLHAHVIEQRSAEHHELVWFRDRLRSDAPMRAAYEAVKRSILASGKTDSYDYAIAKGDYVSAALAQLRRGEIRFDPVPPGA